MDIIIDGSRDFGFTNPPPDLLSALCAIDDYLRENGRIPVAIQVDGEKLVPEKLIESLQNKKIDEVNELEITSRSLKTVVMETLDSIREAVPLLQGICHNLAEIFQSEQPEKGYEPFEQLAFLWGEVKNKELLIIKNLTLDLESLKINGRTLKQHHDELNKYLQEALEALKAQDGVLLGDLLEYELAPRAELEEEIFNSLEAECQKI